MNLETCGQLLIKVNKYADSEFRIKKSRKRKKRTTNLLFAKHQKYGILGPQNYAQDAGFPWE